MSTKSPLLTMTTFRLALVSSTRFLGVVFPLLLIWDTNLVRTPRSISCCPQAHGVPGHIQEAFLDPWCLCAIAHSLPSGMSQLANNKNKKNKNKTTSGQSAPQGSTFPTSGAQLFIPVTGAPTWFRSLWYYNYLGIFICPGKSAYKARICLSFILCPFP